MPKRRRTSYPYCKLSRNHRVVSSTPVQQNFGKSKKSRQWTDLTELLKMVQCNYFGEGATTSKRHTATHLITAHPMLPPGWSNASERLVVGSKRQLYPQRGVFRPCNLKEQYKAVILYTPPSRQSRISQQCNRCYRLTKPVLALVAHGVTVYLTPKSCVEAPEVLEAVDYLEVITTRDECKQRTLAILNKNFTLRSTKAYAASEHLNRQVL